MSDHRKREHIKKEDNCHVFLALKRKKDNEDTNGRTIIRKIIRDFSDDLNLIKAQCLKLGGIWRIYHTVNPRSFNKALKMFKHRLIDDEEEYYYRLDSLWMNCLLSSDSRAEKRFMLDFDNKDFEYVKFVLGAINRVDIFFCESPNGYHVVVEPFDVRLVEPLGVEVVKDGYYFVDLVGESE
jgi:hypothetical protein